MMNENEILPLTGLETGDYREPLTITVWQTDMFGFLLWPTVAHELALSPSHFNIPFGAYRDAPLEAPDGMVNRRNAAFTDWVLVEDHRSEQFYVLASEEIQEPLTYEEYVLGTVIQLDGEYVSYDGGGPIPDWLSKTPPVAPNSNPPIDQE